MNTYFSRTEKILMTRMMLLAGLLRETIREYEKSKAADTAFMRGLRTANTWLGKSIERRYDLLDNDAAKDFVRHVKHMDILFVPNDKAKEERKQLQEMQDSLYMSADTFSKLYAAVIPYTCCRCPRKKDFRQCKLREIFMETGVFPIDSKATNACQYDYLAAGIDLMEWARQNLQDGIQIDDWAKQLPDAGREKWEEAKKETASGKEEAGSRKKV